ncbi:hypothetical protein N9M07_04020 [Candidatus Actinomarina sp.]|nr:hypothetical protein [Candidatus Actinomarina sp.]
MLKISNKTFYYRHKQEIEKYLENKNSLHILNVSSKNKLISTKNKKIFLDPSTSNNVPIKNNHY